MRSHPMRSELYHPLKSGFACLLVTLVAHFYTSCPCLVFSFWQVSSDKWRLHMHHSARQPLFTVLLYVLTCSLGGDSKKRSPIHAGLLLSEGPDKWTWRVWMFKDLLIWFGLKIWSPPPAVTLTFGKGYVMTLQNGAAEGFNEAH